MASKAEQKAFIEMITPYAQADYLKTGVLPSITIAQAIQESSWGTSGLSKNHNNLFGIKSTKDWKGDKINLPTKEWNPIKNAMETINAYFRKYDNVGQSVRDHSDFFWKNKRYTATLEAMKTGDYKKSVLELGKSGYATDPNYGDSLRKLIEGHQLDKIDKGQKPDPMIYIENANENGTYGSNTKEELDKIPEKESLMDKLNPMNETNGMIKTFLTDTLPSIGFVIAGIIVCTLGIVFLFNNEGGTEE